MYETAAIELINSELPGEGDLLDDPNWLAAALERWGLGVGEADLGELRRLRTTLRGLATSISAEGAVSGPALAVLNAELGRAPVRAQLELTPEGLLVDMEPVTSGWSDHASAELAGSFASLLRSAWPPRIKVCQNGECGRAFYDATKNRSRRWCDSRSCGNRMRVRRHRAREGQSVTSI